jgi:MFS family permease
MKKYNKKSIAQLGIGSLIVGFLLAASTFAEFVSQATSTYLTGVGIVAVIMGSILILLPRLSKRQSMIGTVTSFIVLLLAGGGLAFLLATGNFIDPLIQALLIINGLGLILFIIFAAVLVIDGLDVTNDKQDTSRAWWLLFFGEYHWEKYLFWSVGIIFIVIFLLSFLAVGEEYVMDWTDALILGLLSLALGYLSDLRYRLFPEVRTD